MNCISMQKKTGELPMCVVATCNLEGIAPDFEIVRFAEDYMTAKACSRAGHAEAEKRILEQLGLFDEPEFLLDLEEIHNNFVRAQAAKRKALEEAKSHGKR